MTGVMQLVEQGKIDLFAPLETYLPEFASMQYASDFKVGQFPFSWPTEESALLPAQNKIHIHQLMSMTSGMSYDVAAKPIREVVNATNGEANTRQIVAAMAKMPLLFEPGTHYSYALGHDVLAAVIEVVTGFDHLAVFIYRSSQSGAAAFVISGNAVDHALVRFDLAGVPVLRVLGG